MKLPRRNFLHLAAGAAALPTLSRIAWTESYPSRPVRWIVSFAAGAPNDIVARIVGQYLSDHLGQQFVIENRAGAAGNVGMQSALNSPAISAFSQVTATRPIKCECCVAFSSRPARPRSSVASAERAPSCARTRRNFFVPSAQALAIFLGALAAPLVQFGACLQRTAASAVRNAEGSRNFSDSPLLFQRK
jgi:hypothetical protein